jgi:hypothetical protein
MILPNPIYTKLSARGSAVRAACPICDTEFSTEAFEDDPKYDHEFVMNEAYKVHFDNVHVLRE